LVLLGSTGSIGVNTLILAKRYNLPVEVLVAGNNAALLQSQIETFRPKKVVVADKKTAQKISHPNLFFGEEAIVEAIESSQNSLVVNALVGFLGLRPTLAALACGKRVALANKESLVVAGQFIDTKNIVPIDSEHFGLWYLLSGRKIERMSITASGGAFRDKSPDFIRHATLQDVLQHPNWSMGQKITIDSATMVNKMFELIEAHWLFRHHFEKVPVFDAFIETQSIIHALIDFADGSTTAHIAGTDMKLPIAFALGIDAGERILKPVNLVEVGSFSFRPIETERYGIWGLKAALLKNPEKGVIINAANEAAIAHFLASRCGFLEITEKIIGAYEKFEHTRLESLDDIFEADREVRAYVGSF
jgi:1-deoxy-D-xylulose-5-phosphate reductoisomerase